MTAVVLAASAADLRLARAIAGHLGAELLPPPPAPAVARSWPNSEQLVLVMPLGIAVRLVAPHLADKRSDPGVVVVDPAGRFVIPLVGAHHRGAEELADRLATYLHATPVLTTRGAATGGISDPCLLGRPFGVRHEAHDANPVVAAWVEGRPVDLRRDLAWPLGPMPPHVHPDCGRHPLVWVTDRLVRCDRPTVLLRPPVLVVGVGATSEATASEIATAISATLGQAQLAEAAVAWVATIDRRAETVRAATDRPVRALTEGALATVPVPHPSATVAAWVGTPSVAEAAALHAGGELLVPKTRCGRVTVAVARRPERGRLTVVGIGPGGHDHLTPAASEALRWAEVAIGYHRYLDTIRAQLDPHAEVRGSGLGQEAQRAQLAVDQAARGRAVVLVSGGDAGVYGMAGPAVEAAAGAPIELRVIPGVTAGQAAAALLGAPLAHDHAVISLSDHLTPWPVIRRRLEACAAADLVVVLYNPRSSRRPQQLGEALAILRRHREGRTPVGVVRDATRSTETVRLTTLDGLDPTTVDMRTVVIIGNRTTRVVGGRMVTPRHYPSEVPA